MGMDQSFVKPSVKIPGRQVSLYRQRKLAERSGAEHELELYFEPPPRRPRPCFCEYNVICGNLPPEGFACACAGEVGFDVPGYLGRWARMANGLDS